jgi:hypothetical protein
MAEIWPVFKRHFLHLSFFPGFSEEKGFNERNKEEEERIIFIMTGHPYT